MSRRLAAALSLGLLLAGLWAAPVRAASSWVVTTSVDGMGSCTASSCTLRAAIAAANAAGGNGTISFDIAPGGRQTISIGSSQLPPITASNLTIDATTQPSGGAHGIRLDDPNPSDAEAGLIIDGNNVTVRGFSITRFHEWGILIENGSNGDVISGNWVGTPDGTTAAGVGNVGIMIDGSFGNTIGGTNPGDGNVVSATVMGWDGDGIQIHNSNDNVVVGNYVGMTADGLARLPNADSGIELAGGSSGNRIGGLTAAERNVTSGNDGMGMQLLGVMTSATCAGPTNNVIEGNYIGPNANGALPGAYGNHAEGFSIDTCGTGNVVGGASAAARNVISGNLDDGMQIDGLNGPVNGVCNNSVQGDYVGVDPTGMASMPNHVVGIKIQNGACNTLVGGTTAGAGNVVSGNYSDAFYIRRAGTVGTTIQGNIIGLASDGTTSIGQGDNDVHIWGGATQTLVDSNVISASATDGVRIEDPGTNQNTISNNKIGTNAANTGTRGNRHWGVEIYNGPQGNAITRNVVRGNGTGGVAVEQPSGATTATAFDKVSRNQMSSNAGPGIDLQPVAGVNPNDGNNADATVGNDGLDYPVIAGVSSNSVQGTAAPSSTVEVFTSVADTGTPNGEGFTFLGSAAADSSGRWCIDGLSIGGGVTATATDSKGNTSEFSANVSPSGSTAYCGAPSPSPSPSPTAAATASPTPSPTPAPTAAATASPTAAPTASPTPTPSPSTIFSDDFTGTNGSAPANWTVSKSAGGAGSGATIQNNTLQLVDNLTSAQDGLWQYVEARATSAHPSWSAGALTFSWQMSTAATSSQGASFILAPSSVATNVVNQPDYLRVKVSNGVLVVTRAVAGTVTTLWSGTEASGASLRQFQLVVDAANLTLAEGPLGGTPTTRVGPIAHGLAWTSAYVYLHLHNNSAAAGFTATYDTVSIATSGTTSAAFATPSPARPGTSGAIVPLILVMLLGLAMAGFATTRPSRARGARGRYGLAAMSRE